MRVDYTLPALQPESLPEMPIAGEAAWSFREHLRTTAVHLPVSCEQQLRLDVPPFTASYVGPPPRPQSLQLNDAESERLRWRNMVWRHSVTLDGGDGGGSSGTQPVRTMLDLLLDMQHAEDSIVARQVAVTRG